MAFLSLYGYTSVALWRLAKLPRELAQRLFCSFWACSGFVQVLTGALYLCPMPLLMETAMTLALQQIMGGTNHKGVLLDAFRKEIYAKNSGI